MARNTIFSVEFVGFGRRRGFQTMTLLTRNRGQALRDEILGHRKCCCVGRIEAISIVCTRRKGSPLMYFRRADWALEESENQR